MEQYRQIITKLGLSPLPDEGGYYRETYRASSSVNGKLFGSNAAVQRSAGTAIYYLVTPNEFSALHRVKSDEIFHFYLGDPVEMLQISDDGKVQKITLGPEILHGQSPQTLVPAGTWQGSRLRPDGRFALLGTTVSPGFEFQDFELASRSEFIRRFPELKSDIERYTRE